MVVLENNLKDDILIVSYFINENSWTTINKTSYQRVLYFAAVLSPIFIPHEKWAYEFSNTYFGPYNNDISRMVEALSNKGLLDLEERKIYQNRIEERFNISRSGIKTCEDILFNINRNKAKIEWFSIIVKTLSIYGESFLAKLIKADPNIVNLTMINSSRKIPIDQSNNNISKEFFNYIKEKGMEKLNLESKHDKDFLLLFFDILYRKYKGGR